MIDSIECGNCGGSYHPRCATCVEIKNNFGKFICCQNTKKIEVSSQRVRKYSEKSEKTVEMDEKKIKAIIKESFQHYLNPVEQKLDKKFETLEKAVQFMSDSFEQQKTKFDNILGEMKSLKKGNDILKLRLQLVEKKLEEIEVKEKASNIILVGVPKQNNLDSRKISKKNIRGLPTPGPFVVVWKKGTSLISAGAQKVTMDSRITLIGYNLQIKDITHNDQGVYTCQIGDGAQGDLIHTIEILMPPSIQIIPPSGKVVTRKGGPVYFECKANGNPTPTVQWSKKDGLLPSGLQVETGYVLNINEVQRHDAGTYQCTASNGIGQPVTGEVTLHVLYPPEVSVLKSWVNSGEGLEGKLDCVVHADPPAEVTWYQDSFQLQPTDRRVMTKNAQTYSLIIKNVQSSDFGNYSCLVSNSIGRDKRYIELSGKPGPAKIVSSQYSNPHEYDLKWIVQSVFPIVEVRILYRKVMVNNSYHLPGQWHDLLVKPNQHFNPATSERTQWFRLYNLQADSVYECLVQTKNQNGYGELSDLHQWFTSPKGKRIVQSGGSVVKNDAICRTLIGLGFYIVLKLTV